eukprot:1419909-Prymnesium_polylepis.1
MLITEPPTRRRRRPPVAREGRTKRMSFSPRGRRKKRKPYGLRLSTVVRRTRSVIKTQKRQDIRRVGRFHHTHNGLIQCDET